MTAVHDVLRTTGTGNPKGFTLIELIAVLAVLGILIAAIIPTYASLVAEAENKAALSAVAEGKARLTNQYAMMLLREGPRAHRLRDVVEAVSTDAGDYRLIFTVSRNQKEVEITAIGVREGATSGRATATWEIFKDGHPD